MMRYGLYFEIILNIKWLYNHIEIMISAAQMLGSSGACPAPFFLKNVQFGVNIFIRFCIKIVV